MKIEEELYRDKMSQITEILIELREIHLKSKGISDKVGAVHMTLDYENEDFNLAIIGSQHLFRTMIYNMLHESGEAAQDIMEIVEAYRNEKFN